MILYDQLDATIIKFQNQPKVVDKVLAQVESEHEMLLDILVGSHAELLTEEELDYLLFLFLALFETYQREKEIRNYEERDILEAEEFCWMIINENNRYEDAIDLFYDATSQQDVMEFIDLSIAPDEENEIKLTDPGRLILLAVLTALTRVLTGIENKLQES